MKRVIISGVSGFIGKALALKLLEKGVEVWGICVHTEKLADISGHPHFHLIQAEFHQYSQLKEIISERGFDAFFHLAWQDSDKNRNDHSKQVSNILYSCEAAYSAAACRCSKFIFANSSSEFQKSVNKSGEVGLCSIYGAAKHAASQMCQIIAHNNQMTFCGALFVNIFGVGDYSLRSTNTMLLRLINGQHLNLTKGDELYDWTYIDDCISGIEAIAESGKADQIYYVGNRQLRPLREIVTDVRNIVAPDAELKFGSYPDNSYVDFTGLDIYALYRDTGYLPVSDFKESIEKTAKWVKEQIK